MNTEGSVVGEGGFRDSEGWREVVGTEGLWRWFSGVRGVAPPTPLCPSSVSSVPLWFVPTNRHQPPIARLLRVAFPYLRLISSPA